MESGGGSRLGAVLRTTLMVGAYYGVAYTFCNTILKPSTVLYTQFNSLKSAVIFQCTRPSTPPATACGSIDG